MSFLKDIGFLFNRKSTSVSPGIRRQQSKRSFMDLAPTIILIVVGVGIIGIVIGLIYLTITAPKEGYILKKEYSEERYETVTRIDSNGNPVTSVEYRAPSWSIWVCELPPETPDNTCGWRYLNEGEYDSVAIGDYWTS